MSEIRHRSAKRRAAKSPTLRHRRAAGLARWRRHVARRRRGCAVCLAEYSGVALGKLILAGWLPQRSDDYVYRPDEIARAIADLLELGALPRKIT
jgi:hypothetical protein